jgi:hypothetical protein
MNVECVRNTLRWVAGTSLALAALTAVYGMVREHPVHGGYIWAAFIALLTILSLWLVSEMLVSCTNRLLERMGECTWRVINGQGEVIAAQPKARSIVTATLQALEEEAVREACVPQIAERRR